MKSPMTEQPNLSKFCLKCNRFGDHWASECPKGDMLEDWIKLNESKHRPFVEFQHAAHPVKEK